MSQLLRHLRVFAFYALLLTGTLLSITSIVVVLELRDPAIPPEVSRDQLLASLTSTQQMSEARQEAPIPMQLDTARVAMIAAEESPRSAALLAYYPIQQELVGQWASRRADLVAESQQAAEAAAVTYGAEARRPGDNDRLLRFLAMRRWHYEETRKADAYLDAGRVKLGNVNQALFAISTARSPAQLDSAIRRAEVEVSGARHVLSYSHSFAPPPARADVPIIDTVGPGFRIRVFAAMSGWLRTQQSLELASIIGMLGFGLLGAAASAVVRSPRDGKRRVPIGENVTSLVVSGTTSAFATYLAVKGSLAVVSADGAEPNPYVLLLTCFVAAVYWEEAWERVRSAVRREDANEDAGTPADDDVGRPKVALPNMSVVGDDEAAAAEEKDRAPRPA